MSHTAGSSASRLAPSILAILLLVGALSVPAAEPAAPAALAEPARPVSSADRIAAVLLASKDCQTSKVEGAQNYVKCRYTYKGLRFAHVTMRPSHPPPATEAVIQIEYLEPSMVSVQLMKGKGRCLMILDGPSAVTFGVESGKFQPVVGGRPGPDCDSR
jgi:hypothetical protein